MFRLYLLALLVIIVAGLLLTFAAWYVPNPFIRHEVAIDGKGYYLFCLPEAIAPPGNLPNEMFDPAVAEWCNHD